ncbi:MAG: BrnT family toxin [Desulfovibrio sp.]|nr:BrnT family toxin [Desulfovibrio sp.]
MWDEDKNAKNLSKHKVDFLAAVEVFRDPFAVLHYDSEHSEQEERFSIIGIVRERFVLVVIFTDRDDLTRIISARRATQEEKNEYER